MYDHVVLGEQAEHGAVAVAVEIGGIYAQGLVDDAELDLGDIGVVVVTQVYGIAGRRNVFHVYAAGAAYPVEWLNVLNGGGMHGTFVAPLDAGANIC